MKYGAYDPLYPNGIVSVSEEKEIFGVRFLAADFECGRIIDGRALDFETVRTGPNRIDQHYQMTWKVDGKEVSLSWCRLADKMVYGEVRFDEGLEILAEMYVPWEDRLNREWVNFTCQDERIFAGEMISPYKEYQNNAVLFCTDRAPACALSYNQREEQLEDFIEKGTLRNIKRGNIWNDMGISWFLGAHHREAFSFILWNGSAAEFSKETYRNELPEYFQQGRKMLADTVQELTGTGLLKEIGEAFSSILPYNTMYKAHTGRRYIMVDRTWARCEDAWGIQFDWDTFLSSWSASWIDPMLAKENMLSGYDEQLPDGKIPLHSRPCKLHHAEPPITAGRSQHIVQGLTLWNTYLHTRDKNWARTCYEGAKKANAWWFSHRDGMKWGMLGFGYDPEEEVGILGVKNQPYAAKAQYAYFETYDDSPQWTTGEFFKSITGLEEVTEEQVSDEAKYKEQYHMADIYTLERCCLYAVDCECLAKMAAVLGETEDEAFFREQYEKMSDRIQARMWCEEDGCYYNLKFDGTFSKKQSPDCFMPLMTGLVPEDRKRRLLQILKDETKFWGDYMIPSIARDDPAFSDQKYWRGQIWPPQTLWTYLGLKRAGEDQLAWELAVKAAKMLASEWKENGYAPENYNGYTGKCSGAAHYNWGVLMGLPLLEGLVNFQEDQVLFGNPLAEEGMELSNILIDGRHYDLRISEGKTRVFCDGEMLEEKAGIVIIERK